MIQKTDCYCVVCDNCGDTYEDPVTGFSLWTDSGAMNPEDRGWHVTDDGKHYCPDCHIVDDDDNLIIKPKEVKP